MKKTPTKIIPQIQPDFDKTEEDELLKVIRSGWVSESSYNKEFEEMIRLFLQAPFAVTVPNGTQAIAVACLAGGITYGDEVIVPNLTMGGSASGVLLAGARPVFVDVNEKDSNIDPNLIRKKITKKTKAILPVHLNGRPADIKKLLDLGKEYNLLIIEDAAQAFGSKLGNNFLGTIGDMGCFSFSVPKIVTTGQGGLVVTGSKKLYDKIISLKDQGRRQKGMDIYDSIGYNFKFTNLQAALGIAQMKKVGNNLEKKKKIYSLYQKLLSKIPLVKFLDTDLEQTAPWFIDIFVPNRNSLAAYLKKKGVETRAFYPPLHTQIAFAPFIEKEDHFPVTEKLSVQGLYLPSSVNLRKKDVYHICNLIKLFYKNETAK